ncbi:MAG TPA: DEAD/DEAH box helicase [Alphaproteobacteria bacterium]|nr:DEAD/DEAH box helicase [Alphaproteobacteria bacterium]
MLFSELGLHPETLRALEEAGYQTPTPIQEKAIPHVLAGRDVLGVAQTGTGKTASFTLPMINSLAAGRAKARMPRSLILEPTRELAAQVEQAFEVYGKYHKLTTALLIGGESMSDQTKKLDRGVDVLIATPGRLLDQIERGNVLPTDIRFLIIDECDRMLDMGFIPDIERIVAKLRKTRQTLMFSATLPPEIKRLADQFLNDPVEVSVSPPASAATTVTQAMVRVAPADKRAALRSLLNSEDVKNALIFCNRKRDVAIVHKSLVSHGFDAGALHGDMAQSARTETLAKFKADELRLMVCSDVAARGLDIKGLSHVFNFDVPMHSEDYVHRIGRTGRAGLSGRAFMLVTREDAKYLAAIEKLIGTKIPEVTLDGFGGADATPEVETSESSRPKRRPRKESGSAEARPRESAPRAPRTRTAGPRNESPRPAVTQDGNPREPREDRRERSPRGRSDDRRPRYDDDDDDNVVGFGNDIPAFLQAAPRQRRG